MLEEPTRVAVLEENDPEAGTEETLQLDAELLKTPPEELGWLEYPEELEMPMMVLTPETVPEAVPNGESVLDKELV